MVFPGFFVFVFPFFRFSEVINENSISAFNYLDDFSKHLSDCYLKACSHDPFLRIRFLVPKTWKQAFRRSDFKVTFLW